MKGRFHANDAEAIRALVEMGEGVAWLLDFLTRDATED